MEKVELEIGDIVQLNPEHKFGGMLIVVTDPKSWGCQGYLMSHINFDAFRYKGIAYIRAIFEDFEYIGKILWMYEHKREKEEEEEEEEENETDSLHG